MLRGQQSIPRAFASLHTTSLSYAPSFFASTKYDGFNKLSTSKLGDRARGGQARGTSGLRGKPSVPLLGSFCRQRARFVPGAIAYRSFSSDSSSSSFSLPPSSLEQQNNQFQLALMARYAMYVLSKNKRFSAAIKGIGSMEDASRTWCKECNRLNVDMKTLVDYVHEVPGDYTKVEKKLQEPMIALLVVDMMIHEGKQERAKSILANTAHFSTLQQQHAKLYIGQVHFNEQKMQEARKVAFDLLENAQARESAVLMRGVLDILTVERPDDPPFYLDVKQMSEILANLELVMRKYSLECDFMRLIKRWAIPVWEQMNIDNHKNNKRLSSQQSRVDGGNHLSLLLHPFILTFAQLEQIQSELFESQFTMLRRDLLMSRDQDSSTTFPGITDDAVAAAIAHQTMFNQACWEETDKEEARIKQLQERVEQYLKENGAESKGHTQIETDLLHLAMYRPLTRVSGFERIAAWDLTPFKIEVRSVLHVHVLEPVEQKALAHAQATALTPISSQNQGVVQFYTSHIFPAWRSTGRELWPSSIRQSLSLYYGKSLMNETDDETSPALAETVLIAGCGSCHEVAMMALAHPEAIIAALDMSSASLGYGMQRLKELGLDKNVKYYIGDLELLDPSPPSAFNAGFDLITASGVLHHLKNPIVGWRKLVEWLKPGGIMSIGLYSRLARIPCAQLRAEVAQKMEFTPALFGSLPGTEFVSMIREPTADELRQIRKHVLSSPQYATLAKKSMGEFKDMLCHPQERIYSLPEVGALLENLGLEFLGFMLDDDAEIRKEFAVRFPQDKEMDNLLNWDKYEQEKPWTFSGMYFFHCRKIDKNRQQQLYEKYNKQERPEREQRTTSPSNYQDDQGDDALHEDGLIQDDDERFNDAQGDEMDDEVKDDTNNEIPEGDVSHENERGDVFPQRAGYSNPANQHHDVVEADYEEVSGNGANFKANTKYK
eukprot:Phypoly_transcript_02225.p1 GENE.Phypoly_transcript_02225~~Phypoly_transcript_02225.p1  ORF type:complete len:946 (+),score=164.15 Phypoly_transcript_02225:71-2908(+)